MTVDDIIYEINQVQTDFALEVWFSIVFSFLLVFTFFFRHSPGSLQELCNL